MFDFEEIEEIFDAIDNYTVEDAEGIFIEPVEKAWKHGGGFGASSGLGGHKGSGPGSRGGKYWTDSNGKVRYGQKPKGHVEPTKAKPKATGQTSKKPHSTAKPHATSTSTKKPKDYRVTRTPKETLFHLHWIIQHGGLPGGPKLSQKDLDHLKAIAGTMESAHKNKTTKVSLETAIQHLTDGTTSIQKISSNRAEIIDYLGQLETTELKIYFLKKAVDITPNFLQKEYFTQELNRLEINKHLGFIN